MPMTFQEIMEYYRPNSIAYKRIKDGLDALVPFVGAGLSAFAYPTWNGALRNFGEYAPEEEERAQIKTQVQAGEYETAADMIYKALGRLAFYSAVRDLFGEEKINDQQLRRQAVALVPRLFKMCITTNFDRVLEHAFALCGVHCDVAFPDNEHKLNAALKGENIHLLFKVHGDLRSDSEDIVFTGESYHRHYDTGSPLVEQLTKWMQGKRLLFLGASLGSDRTMDVLCRTIAPGGENFAIVPCKEGELKTRRKELDDKNVLALFYPEGEHDCVRVILEKLLEDTDPEAYRQLSCHICALQPQYSRFEYRAERTEFVGRDAELECLAGFLATEAPIQWWAVTGAGGSGKSRLAHEFAKRIPNGWRAVEVRQADYGKLEERFCFVTENTLFILDYVQAYVEQIGRWLRVLDGRGAGSSRIRVLLIERDSVEDEHASWLDRLRDCIGAALMDRVSYGEPMQLQPCGEEDLKLVIRSYAKSCGAELGENDADQLYEVLKQVDPDYIRPLYAMFITDASINGQNPHLWNAEQVLNYINDRELERLDRCIAASFGLAKANNRKFYQAIYELKMIATINLGLMLTSDAENLCGDSWAHLLRKLNLDGDELCDLLYNAAIATKETSDSGGPRYQIMPMQPDIAGEYFVLKLLEGMEFTVVESLLASLWSNPVNTSIFMVRLLRDHIGLLERMPELLKRLLFPFVTGKMGVEEQDFEYYIFLVAASSVCTAKDTQLIIDYFESNLPADGGKKTVIYIPYAMCLVNNAVNQDTETFKKTLQKLEIVYQAIRIDALAGPLARGLVISANKAQVFEKELIEQLYALTTEHKQSTVVADMYGIALTKYANTHHNFCEPQWADRLEELYNIQKTESLAELMALMLAYKELYYHGIGVNCYLLKGLYQDHPTEIMQDLLVSVLGQQAFTAYEKEDYIRTEELFYELYKIGNRNATINLAYMVRRGECIAHLELDPLELLKKALDLEEPLALMNAALYLIDDVDEPDRWKRADAYVSQIKAGSDGLNGVVQWWSECAANRTQNRRGELDRREGALVLFWLARHGLIPYHPELPRGAKHYYPDMPDWMLELSAV